MKVTKREASAIKNAVDYVSGKLGVFIGTLKDKEARLNGEPIVWGVDWRAAGGAQNAEQASQFANSLQAAVQIAKALNEAEFIEDWDMKETLIRTDDWSDLVERLADEIEWSAQGLNGLFGDGSLAREMRNSLTEELSRTVRKFR